MFNSNASSMCVETLFLSLFLSFFFLVSVFASCSFRVFGRELRVSLLPLPSLSANSSTTCAHPPLSPAATGRLLYIQCVCVCMCAFARFAFRRATIVFSRGGSFHRDTGPGSPVVIRSKRPIWNFCWIFHGCKNIVYFRRF